MISEFKLHFPIFSWVFHHPLRPFFSPGEQHDHRWCMGLGGSSHLGASSACGSTGVADRNFPASYSMVGGLEPATNRDLMGFHRDFIGILKGFIYIYITIINGVSVYHNWLVVWNMTFKIFHILGIIIPTDFHIFQTGRYTTNQMV